MASKIDRVKAIEHGYRKRIDELGQFGDSATRVLVEAFGQVVTDLLKIEDDGWLPIQASIVASDAKGLTLDDAIKVTKYIETQTKVMGGLLGRGLRLKNNHAFGRGYEIKTKDGTETKAWVRNVIEDEDNWDTVFSPTALKELNRILFTSGNLLLMYDSSTKTFERLSIDINVKNSLTYPGNHSRIKYILRTYDNDDDLAQLTSTKPEMEWVPTLAYRNRLRRDKKQLPESLPLGPGENAAKMIKVNQTSVIIEKRVNKDNGDTWGVPDAFGAVPWAVLYSTYLKDGAKLQNALAAISYLVKARTELAAKTAGAKLSNGRIAQAAIGGPETEISQVPRAGAVDLYEGRPIQAQAASNMDVSVTGLASDPGLGGSYASENALSQPEQLAALSRQEDFRDLFRQIFSAMGGEATNMQIDFRRLDVDPIHRTMQSLSMARELGGISQREYRERATELLDIDKLGTGLPKPDLWTGKKVTNNTGGDSDNPADPDGNGVTPGQGKSGAVGTLDDNGNGARADDKAAGTA